jgi:hypothetical protein
LDYRVGDGAFCVCRQFVGGGETFQSCEAKTNVNALVRGNLEMVDVSFTKNQTMVAIEVSKIQKRSPVFMAAESNGKSIT